MDGATKIFREFFWSGSLRLLPRNVFPIAPSVVSLAHYLFQREKSFLCFQTTPRSPTKLPPKVSSHSKMCFKVLCSKCNKFTWSGIPNSSRKWSNQTTGCGMHIESALRGVPADQRCSCNSTSSHSGSHSSKPHTTKTGNNWESTLLFYNESLCNIIFWDTYTCVVIYSSVQKFFMARALHSEKVDGAESCLSLEKLTLHSQPTGLSQTP